MIVKTGIGQDSHRFDLEPENGGGDEEDNFLPRGTDRPLVLGGVIFEGAPPLIGNSDADAALHALCNAVSGITGVNVLGEISDRMCLEKGVTDSSEYVREAMKYLTGGRITHASFSIECARPRITPKIEEMRNRIAKIVGIEKSCVCITATSGEGLTDFGRGLGIQVFCVVTAIF